MKQWLCIFLPHKWVHITDVVVGKNCFEQPILRGLYQCKRCKELSKGRCSQKPDLERNKIT